MRRRSLKPIDDSERVVKDRLRSRERTMHRARRLLAAKPRSVEELRSRLLEKLWTDKEIVEDILKKLEEYSYLDDEQFASDTALSRLRQKPQGRRKLRETLSRKQLTKETVDAEIENAFENMPEERLIIKAMEKRFRLKGIPETREEMKKFNDHLMRLGFSYGLIKEQYPIAVSQSEKTAEHTEEQS